MTRLTLKNGEWVDVKDGFKMRDKKDVHTYSSDGVSSDGNTYRLSPVKFRIANVAARLLNWSLTEESFGKGGAVERKPIAWPSGKSFRERLDVVENLDEDVFEEISELLGDHLEKVSAAAVAEKNETPTGETASGGNSPSVN